MVETSVAFARRERRAQARKLRLHTHRPFAMTEQHIIQSCDPAIETVAALEQLDQFARQAVDTFLALAHANFTCAETIPVRCGIFRTHVAFLKRVVTRMLSPA